MSDQTASIFATNQEVTPQTTTNSNPTPPNDPIADLLKEIKNESGAQKYANPVEALRGLQHAQTFISQLKTEKSTVEQQLQQLRDENERLRNVESVLERLTSQQQQQVKENTTQTPVLDENKIAELIARTLEQKETKQTMEKNTATVVSKLQAHFGDKAGEVFYTKAAELGMSKEEINMMAAKNPKAIDALFGFNSKSQERFPAPMGSTINTTGIQPTQTSFIKKNDKPTLIGATSEDMIQEHRNAKQLVDELNQRGMSIDDLTKPSNYFKLFK